MGYLIRIYHTLLYMAFTLDILIGLYGAKVYIVQNSWPVTTRDPGSQCGFSKTNKYSLDEKSAKCDLKNMYIVS